jgi:hypothetical protein
MFPQPTDVLAPTLVARAVELMEGHEQMGCVLAQADLLLPSGEVAASRRRLAVPLIDGDAMIRIFMEQGLELNTRPIYRTEAYELHYAEGVVFNHFPDWLPQVMAASIADFGYLETPLVLRSDPRSLAGDAFIPSVEACFEHYLFIHAFGTIAARLDRQDVRGLMPTAIETLARNCLASAIQLLRKDDVPGTRAYASLALTFLPGLADEPEFQELAGSLAWHP